MKKSVKILIIVLCLIIVGLVTFIVVDKIMNQNCSDRNENITSIVTENDNNAINNDEANITNEINNTATNTMSSDNKVSQNKITNEKKTFKIVILNMQKNILK